MGAGLILVLILAAALVVASVLTTSEDVASREPAAVTPNWLVDPDYLQFRRAETGEPSIHGTDWPPRPVIEPRDVKHVDYGGPYGPPRR